jgi:hypothetical protein
MVGMTHGNGQQTYQALAMMQQHNDYMKMPS